MFEHLQYSRAVIRVKTAAGKQAEKILDFNDAASVEYREFVLDLIGTLEKDRRELVGTIRDIERQMGLSPQRSEEHKPEKDSAEEQLRRIESHLSRLTGAT